MISNPYEAPNADNDDQPSEANQRRHPYAGCAAAFFLIAGLIGTLLGSAWIRTFGFTNYRAHLAYIGLPLGLFTLLFSIVFLLFGIAIVRKR